MIDLNDSYERNVNTLMMLVMCERMTHIITDVQFSSPLHSPFGVLHVFVYSD